MLEHKTRFSALLRNELEKLWAHRARALVIAFVVVVVGGSLLTYRGFEASQRNLKLEISSLRQQEAKMRRQASQLSGKSKQALEQNLQAIQNSIANMESQGTATNNRHELSQLKQQLRQEPPSQQGQTLEQMALIRSMLDHGIHSQDPGRTTGFAVVGSVFGSAAMMFFGLIAAGLASDRISSELEGGTWGPLLLHAPRRVQIYWAKLTASVIMVWGFMAASALGFFAMMSALLGFGNPAMPEIIGLHLHSPLHPGMPPYIPVQTFHVLPQWSYDVAALALAMVSAAALAAIFLLLSMLTRSTVFSLVVSALLVISGVVAGIVARAAGWLVVIDPAVHLPLVSDWTGRLAMQYGLRALTLGHGLLVVVVWGAAALVAGVLQARRLDV